MLTIIGIAVAAVVLSPALVHVLPSGVPPLDTED